MSTTVTAKLDDQQRKAQLKEAEEQLRKQKQDEQQQRLSDQNWWFYSLMDIDKVKAAKTQDKKLEIVRKGVATETKKDEQQQKVDVAEAKYEPLYKDRLARSEKKLTDEQFAEFESIIADARNGDWSAAEKEAIRLEQAQ